MSENVFEFDPNHLTPLITFLYKRNESIGYPVPSAGITQDIIEFYFGYLTDKKYYEEIINFYKKGALNKLDRIRQLITEARQETNFIRQRQLLIEIVELQKQLELFYPTD